jgi:predicted nucleic acid-binding protein
MRLVVDASVAIKWMIDEPDSDIADRLLDGGHDLLAPELIIAEVISAAWKQRRLGSIGDALYDEIVSRIADGPIVCRPLRSLAASAAALARALDPTTASISRSPRPRTCRS